MDVTMKFYTYRDSKSNAVKVPTVFPSRHNGAVFLPKELRGRQKYRKQQRPQFCSVNKHSKSLNSEVSKLGPDASRGSHGVATHMPLNYGGPQVHANLRPKTSHTIHRHDNHTTLFFRGVTPHWGNTTLVTSWWRGTVVERRSLAGELSLSCARPAADG